MKSTIHSARQISKGGFRTKAEALAAGTTAMNEYNSSGQTFTPTEVSVSDYLDYWFENYCKMDLKYNTQLRYLYIVENRLKPRFGQYRLKSLTTAVIQEYVNQLKIDGLARSSVVGILSVLSAAYEYAIEPLQYVKENPCSRVKIPKFEKQPKERIVIPPEDFKKILERFPNDTPFYLPLMIGYYTGLRISETFALCWSDIDFENRTLSVTKSAVKRNYGVDVRKVLEQKGKKEEKSAWYFGTPKTESSVRTIKFGDALYKALKHAQVEQKKNRLLYGEYVSTDSFKYCSRVIHHELKLAFDFHSLRHTHATML